MIPLLFIILITGLGVLISTFISPEVTWFDYYLGGVAGLFVSAVAFHFWNKSRRKKEEKAKKLKERGIKE